jgi:hypothetical protein
MPTDVFTYVLTGAGGAVSAEELETAYPALEIRILWGSTVLHVVHLTPPRSFFVGDAGSGCDYELPGEVLGTRRAPVVVLRHGRVLLVVPERAHAYTERANRGRESMSDLAALGLAVPSAEWPGCREIELPQGSSGRVGLPGSALSFHASVVRAGKRPAAALGSDLEPAALAYGALSFLFHVGVLASFAFFMPRLSADDGGMTDRSDVFFMRKLLDASAAREEQALAGARGESPAGSEASSEAPRTPAPTESKIMRGSPQRGAANDARASDSDRSPRDRSPGELDSGARERALSYAADFGTIPLLHDLVGRDLAPSTDVWGSDAHAGGESAMQRGMFNRSFADIFGVGGPDLTGTGNGQPGDGVIAVHDIGDGWMPGGPESGVGRSRGPSWRGHPVSAPKVRDLLTTVNGRLAPEVIQRVVRQNFGRFRFCYESGLRANPSLEGRVVVKFVIDRSGAVSLSASAGGDLPDASVTACVVRAFTDLSFPTPEAGMVTVVYPIVFTPM